MLTGYLTNRPAGKLTDVCEMMLLYPTVDSPLSHDFVDGQHKIKIRTINLDQPWQGIHHDLLALVA
jgi:5-methylcytosine-specific restriction enzyme subunit McrC